MKKSLFILSIIISLPVLANGSMQMSEALARMEMQQPLPSYSREIAGKKSGEDKKIEKQTSMDELRSKLEKESTFSRF